MEPVLPILITFFWAAILVGLVVRLIRAKKGKRLRAIAEPLVAAADSYQENLIGKTGTAEFKATTEGEKPA